MSGCEEGTGVPNVPSDVVERLLGGHEDLYAVLGCAEEAGPSELRKGFRRQSLQCHPDRHPNDPHAAERFAHLKVVLDCLLQEGFRQRYLCRLQQQRQQQERFRAMDEARRRQREEVGVLLFHVVVVVVVVSCCCCLCCFFMLLLLLWEVFNS